MVVQSVSELPLAKDFSSFISVEASARKKSPLKSLLVFMKGNMISLGGGLPHPSTFPFTELSSVVKSAPAGTTALKDTKKENIETVSVPLDPTDGKVESLAASLQYGGGLGMPSLRNFCKTHIESMHKPQYKDWEVIMTCGNTDSFTKALALLLNRGDYILIEKWAYPTAMETIEPLGITAVPIPVDGEGVCPKALRQTLENWGSEPHQTPENKPRVAYLVPTGQNPTGATMGLQRRRDIMAIAQQHNLIIIEDDPYYYLQFSIDDGWMPSLLSLDTDGRVIRLDSFSKTLAPGCRVGYATMNKQFREYFQFHTEVTVQQPSGFSQAVLAEMLVGHWGQEGYTRYLTERVRIEYLNRSKFLQSCLRKYVNSELISFVEPSAGMFIWLKVHVEKHPRHGQVTDSALMLELFNACIAEDVLLTPGWQFSTKPKPQNADLSKVQEFWFDDEATFLRATFAYADFPQMEKAAQSLGVAVTKAFAA
ncbi:hypothetical protein DFQ26_009885 [Actinomortierella ambigua]|nr:hypothetical protein DFQ26_009885 [Actinomortierella ambigua]